MKNNGEQMNEFLDGLIDLPHGNENIKLLARRMRQDDTFHFDLLLFATMLSISFPDLFLKMKIGLMNEIINPERKS